MPRALRAIWMSRVIEHGRLGERARAVVSLDELGDGFVALSGRRHAFRVVRQRTVLATGRRNEVRPTGWAGPAWPPTMPDTVRTACPQSQPPANREPPTFATLPATRTARAYVSDACLATLPACPTRPSRSSRCVAASTASDRHPDIARAPRVPAGPAPSVRATCRQLRNRLGGAVTSCVLPQAFLLDSRGRRLLVSPDRN